jgi:hypothetical protein
LLAPVGGERQWFPRLSPEAAIEATSPNAVADIQAATARRESSSPLFWRLSMLKAPAPNATICRSPPAIITFLRKWIICVWAARDERDLGGDLSRVYGFPVDVRAKLSGFATVASALQSRDIAKAQIAALLLRLPDPPPPAAVALNKSAERRLSEDLIACGLLKADDGWDEE